MEAGHSQVVEARVLPAFTDTQSVVVNGNSPKDIAGGKKFAGQPEQVDQARERMALRPERLLLSAPPDLQAKPGTILQSINQNVVVFTLVAAPAGRFLNSYTHLPTAVDYSGPLARSGYWRFLGDVTTRTYYVFWWPGKDGIHLHMQWNVESNGLPDECKPFRRYRQTSRSTRKP